MTNLKYTFGYNADYYYLCITLFLFELDYPGVHDMFFIILALPIVNYAKLNNLKALFLIIFCLSYVFIDPRNILEISSFLRISFTITFMLCYLIGKKIFYISKSERIRARTLFLIMPIAWGFFGALSLFKTNDVDPSFILNRHYINFFNGIDVHALGMTANFIVLMALLPYLIYLLYKTENGVKLFDKLILIISIILGAWGFEANNELQNRSPFVVALICALLPLFFMSKELKSLKYSYSKFLFFILAIGLAMLIYLGFETDDFLNNGNVSRLESEDLDSNGRTDLWLYGLDVLWEYPLGGVVFSTMYDQMSGGEGGYFHNLWLDTAKISGFMPLMFLTAFQFSHLKQFKNFLTSYSGSLKIFFIIINFCILFMYLTEPVIELSPHFFYYSIMLFGYISEFKNPIAYKNLRYSYISK